MDKILKVTTIQTHLFWEDVQKNLINFELKIKNIDQPTDVIVLPEMFTTGFSMNPSKFAESMDGKTINWMKKMASKKDALTLGALLLMIKTNL
jgi:omega-amidase